MKQLEMKYFVLRPKGNDLHAEASRAAMISYSRVICRDPDNLLWSKQIMDWVNNAAANAAKENQNG